jgi:putative heme-binding domain-containing protein
MIRSTIFGRLVRRLAALEIAAGDSACARLIASAPSSELRRPLMAALEEATRGRRAGSFAPDLPRLIIDLADREPADVPLTKMAARMGNRQAGARTRALAVDRRAPEQDRLEMLDLMGELKDFTTIRPLLDLATGGDAMPIRFAALSALGRFEDESVATVLIAEYPRQAEAWRSRARDLLLSRSSWARAYLSAIDRGAVSSGDVTLDELGRFATLRAPGLAALVRKHWGMTRGTTHEERLAEVRRLNNDLRAAPGDPMRGRPLFRDRCATCHRLHGEGETIGPDLTYANRRDRDFLLISLVDPAVVVRKEYQAYNLATRDGRILTGLIVEQTPDSVTLRGAKGERTRVARTEIEELKELDASLMPESLYQEFSPGQLRDLFSFLESEPLQGRNERP